MGLDDAIRDAVGSAFTAIADLATQLTYVVVTPGVYVPDAGTSFPPNTEHSTEGIILNYQDREFDGDRIRRGDRKILIEQAELTPIPNLGDRIEVTATGLSYNIIQLKQDPVSATWTFQVRINE